MTNLPLFRAKSHSVSGRGWVGLCVLVLSPLSAGSQSLGGERIQIHGPLSLTQAVQIGLRENLMIQAARADVETAAAETRIARSMTRPQISANSFLSAGDAANIFTTAPDVTPVNKNRVPPGGYIDLNLELMFPLYTGGRLNNMVRAASERQRAALADVGGVQAETALMLKDAYYRALLAAEFVKVAQARVDAGKELVRTTQARLDAGKGIEADVRRTEAELADAVRMITTARNDVKKAVLDLKTVLGVRPDSDITLSDTLGFLPPAGDVNRSLAEAARTRPELEAARARSSAAQAQTGSVKGSLQPQIYAGVMADAFTSRSMGNGKGYTAGVTVSYPLFDAGQRRSEVTRARAQQQRAAAEAQNMELRVSNEVSQAWLDVETAAQNYRTAQTAVQAAQSAYEVIVLRVQNQKSILVEQLDALAALIRARANLAQALYDHSLAAARLQRAIGNP